MNRFLGWGLLVAGLVGAAWLDPWSLSERSGSLLAGSPRMAARNAQSMVLGMALLQLAVARVLAADRFPPSVRRSAAWLTAAGAVLYALGCALWIPWPAGAGLIPVGALMNFAGLAALSWTSRKTGAAPGTAMVLAILAMGMLIDATMGLFAVDPVRFVPAYLGPEDGLRLRMLRLSQAAALALPILALLSGELVQPGKRDPTSGGGRSGASARSHRVLRGGQVCLLCGALGMPVILTATALTSLRLKHLLPVPADLVFAGTLCAVWWTRRHASRLEFWGWLLVALSMFAGLLMGLYAFDGPLPAPHFLGAYNDFPRRLARLGHAYCILLGLLCLFVAREREVKRPRSRSDRAGVPLLVAGTVTTLAAIAFVAVSALPPRVLSAGPLMVAAGTLLCIAPERVAKRG
jgi:hypothetical protein